MCGGHSETANAMNFGANVKKEFLGSDGLGFKDECLRSDALTHTHGKSFTTDSVFIG